jgi:hypothetical protein
MTWGMHQLASKETSERFNTQLMHSPRVSLTPERSGEQRNNSPISHIPMGGDVVYESKMKEKVGDRICAEMCRFNHRDHR